MWLSASGILVLFLYVNPTLSREACPDSVIKEAIISLAHIMRDNTKKLERHEAREHQLGEWMKKAVVAVTKKINGLETLKTQFSKIEDRMTGIEQLISQRDERERIQIQKTANMIENLENHLVTRIEQINSTIHEVSSSVVPTPPVITAESIASDILAKFNETGANFVGRIAMIEFGLNSMASKNEAEAKKRAGALETLFAERDEKERKQIEETRSLINNLEKRLGAQIEKINTTISEVGNCIELTQPPLTAESITSKIIAKLENTEAQFVGQIARIEFDLNTATSENQAEVKKQAQILERLSTERDEREEKQINKTANLIEDLEKRLGAQIKKINSTISEVGNCIELTQPPLTAESITSKIIAKLENTEAQFVGQIARIEFDLNTATSENQAEVKKQAQILERLSTERDEREEKQINKTANLIEDLEKRLGAQIKKINSSISEVGNCIELTQPPLTAESITSKIISRLNETEANFVGQVARIESDLTSMAMKNGDDAVALKSVFTEVKNISNIITDIESSLEKLNKAAKEKKEKVDEEAVDVAAMIKEQNEALNRVTELLKDTANRVQELPTQLDVETFHNETQAALQETKSALEDAVSNGTSGVIDRVGENLKAINKSVEALSLGFANNTQYINNELENLIKSQAVMVQTADNVMSMKQNLEYQFLQIIADVGEITKSNSELLNKTLYDKLDYISLDIMSNQSNALANLTAKTEKELNEIWRQINLMYLKTSNSATALDELREQSKVYINDTSSQMNGMESKVGDIKEQIIKVTGDLSYLLRQLSFITHEFNKTKTEFGTAVEAIKNSLKEVRQEANDLTEAAINGSHPVDNSYFNAGSADTVSSLESASLITGQNN